MNFLRRFITWIRGDDDLITNPDRAITEGTAPPESVDTVDHSTHDVPQPQARTCNCQARLEETVTAALQAMQARWEETLLVALTVMQTNMQANYEQMNTRINAMNDRLHRNEADYERVSQQMQQNREENHRVFRYSPNYRTEDEERIPENFVQSATMPVATIQQNGDPVGSSAVSNEDIQNAQNRNEASSVSEEEPAGQPGQPSSQNLRVPTEQSTIRVNNDVTVGSCYEMTHKNRGLCVIFSHELFKYECLPQRSSAGKEARMIDAAFKRKGFRTLICQDYTCKKIMKTLSKLEDQVRPDDDCICICVSTHGEEGLLWALDFAYPTAVIENTLSKIKKLVRKPKLIFIQACRGKKVDRGISLNQTDSEREDETDCPVDFERHPTRADFFIVHSTPYGYVSWRNWFFMAFCHNLDKFSEKDDIDEILRKTARKMCAYESRCYDDRSKNRAKQVPSVYSTLTKRLFLKRKMNDSER